VLIFTKTILLQRIWRRIQQYWSRPPLPMKNLFWRSQKWEFSGRRNSLRLLQCHSRRCSDCVVWCSRSSYTGDE
jgi:hypothetical protein